MQELEFKTLREAEEFLTFRGLVYTGQDGMLGSFYATRDNARKAHLAGSDLTGWWLSYWFIH